MCNVPFSFFFFFFFCNAFLHPPLPLSAFISVIRAWYCSARLVAFFCRRVFIKDKMIHIHVVRHRHTKNSEWGSKDLRRRERKKRKRKNSQTQCDSAALHFSALVSDGRMRSRRVAENGCEIKKRQQIQKKGPAGITGSFQTQSDKHRTTKKNT